MDLNKLKEFLPVTTVLLVIFYVSAFFIKLGEMIYFSYPFALFKFSFADALLYSVKAIPIILLSTIYSITIYQIFSKFKKADRASWIMLYGFAALYISVSVIVQRAPKEIVDTFKIREIFIVFDAFGMMIIGFLIIGIMNWRLRQDIDKPKQYLKSLGAWYVINICMVSIIFSYKGDDVGWFVLSMAFSITLNMIKCFEYVYKSYIQTKQNSESSYKITTNDLSVILIILPILSAMLYGFLFHQIPVINKTVTNDGGVVAGQYDNSLIVGYCDNNQVYFKIVDPNSNKNLTFSRFNSEKSSIRTLRSCGNNTPSLN